MNNLQLNYNKNINAKKYYLHPKQEEIRTSNSISKNQKIYDLLFKAVGLWLLKDEDNMIFNGSAEQVKILSNVMLATKDFYTYLKSDVEMNLDVMKSLLDRKNTCARKFEHMFSVKWPF